MTVLHDLDDKLTVFGFCHFDKKFIKKLKKEMPKIVKYDKADNDLARIPSTRQYHTRIQKRIQRKNLPKYTVLDWKKYAGEYEKRIWK